MFADRNLIFDAALVEFKAGIAAAGNAPHLSATAGDSAVAGALQAAAPAYRAAWWPRHDAANRAWVAAALPLLERYGEAIAAGVTSAFRTRWHATTAST